MHVFIDRLSTQSAVLKVKTYLSQHHMLAVQPRGWRGGDKELQRTQISRDIFQNMPLILASCCYVRLQGAQQRDLCKAYLRTIGVGSGIRHRYRSRPVGDVKILIGKLSAVDAVTTGPAESAVSFNIEALLAIHLLCSFAPI